MASLPIILPKPVPAQRERPPQKNIPQTRAERERLLQMVKLYVRGKKPVPPLSMDELSRHADAVIPIAGTEDIYRDYIAVLIGNEMWREALAAVPYERRLLLLPKCLRVEEKCPAPFDEFGLLCKQCGLCTIQDLQAEAERLGYAVLVAEGSAIVMAIIETGKIDAVVGVSCLSVLERAFPHMEAAAIPGIAIPLLQDDCANTNVDLEWIWDVIHLTSEDKTRRLDLDSLRSEVQAWFTRDSLEDILGQPSSQTEQIALEWLSRSGKRWRPFLTVCTYRALREGELPADTRKIAVAVECFHKASLIHDDIEDGDSTRYGEKTLHDQYGVPVALNVGDFLIGEGYRLLAECDALPEARARMISAAARGHRTLSMGQGEELCWMRSPKPLSSVEVLDIFRKKTAPAFEVALQLGALYAGEAEGIWDVLGKYSESLGIAYQIRDDLNDFSGDGESEDLRSMRPSLLLSVAYERAQGEEKELMESVWRRSFDFGADSDRLEEIFSARKVEERVRSLLESYKEEAVNSLRELENASLKGLLRRVVGKVFNDLQIKGWCSEFEARNAGAGAGPPPSA
ncbi:MAG: polyprenyl synthetase family protein [Acidobacteriota bacterium]